MAHFENVIFVSSPTSAAVVVVNFIQYVGVYSICVECECVCTLHVQLNAQNTFIHRLLHLVEHSRLLHDCKFQWMETHAQTYDSLIKTTKEG